MNIFIYEHGDDLMSTFPDRYNQNNEKLSQLLDRLFVKLDTMDRDIEDLKMEVNHDRPRTSRHPAEEADQGDAQ